jgi:hypothetical protein
MREDYYQCYSKLQTNRNEVNAEWAYLFHLFFDSRVIITTANIVTHRSIKHELSFKQ